MESINYIGCATLPYFALGLAIGAVDVLLQLVLLNVLNALGLIDSKANKEKTEKYNDDIIKNPLMAIIWVPLIEELLFRAGLQPLLMFGLIAFFPALAVTSFYATGLSVAAAVAIFCTSLIFGLLHASSSEDNDNYAHAFFASLGGIVLGVAAVQFGLIAAIAAHIMNNLIAITLMIAFDTPEALATEKTDVNLDASFLYDAELSTLTP